MIKILFFIETLEGGGAEKVLRNLVNNMDQTRFDITVQTVWPCDSEKYLTRGICFKSLFPSRSALNNLRYRFEAETGLAYKLHIRDNYDIEVAYLECGATKVMASSTNKKAKKLAWVHCDLLKAMDRPDSFADRTKLFYKKYDKVVCVSENVQRSFISLFGEDIPTEVVYNTIDDEEIREKAGEPFLENIKKQRLTVVSVGRLSAPKSYLRLLKSHKRLLEEGFDHDLWILGEGPERPALEEYIALNNLQESVTMFGFQENPYCFMKEADLLVCSSEYEGYSTFVTEGIILGKPIVTTDCGGMREILGNSEFGLITENSESGVYEGMKKMLADEQCRQNFSNKAKKRAESFMSKSLARDTEAFFERSMRNI